MDRPDVGDQFETGTIPIIELIDFHKKVNVYSSRSSIPISGRVRPLLHDQVQIELVAVWPTGIDRVIGVSTTVTPTGESQFGLTLHPPTRGWTAGDYRLDVSLRSMPQVRTSRFLRLQDPDNLAAAFERQFHLHIPDAIGPRLQFDALRTGTRRPFRISRGQQLMVCGTLPESLRTDDATPKKVMITVQGTGDAGVIAQSGLGIVIDEGDRLWFERPIDFPQQDTNPGVYEVVLKVLGKDANLSRRQVEVNP